MEVIVSSVNSAETAARILKPDDKARAWILQNVSNDNFLCLLTELNDLYVYIMQDLHDNFSERYSYKPSASTVEHMIRITYGRLIDIVRDSYRLNHTVASRVVHGNFCYMNKRRSLRWFK